jgi:hypothetical protein
MNSLLKQIVEQRLNEPGVLGRLACRLRENDAVEQQHHDGRKLGIKWRERPGHWRCTVFANQHTDESIVQVDLHSDGDIRIESHEPVSVHVSLQNNLLCITCLQKCQV